MKKTEYIHVKVTPEEKKQIQQNAKKNNLDVSNYIRYIALKK